MRHNILRLLSFLLAGVLVIGANTALLAQQGSRQWKVVQSVPNPKEKDRKKKPYITRKATLTLEPPNLICQPKDKKFAAQTLSIPLNTITEVAYDKQARRRLQEGAAVMLVSLGIGAIVMATKSTNHYVIITTKTEGAEPQEHLFQLDKGDYRAFLDEMQRVTSKPWLDRDAEDKRTLNDLEQAKSRAVPITLQNAARVGKAELRAGQYQVILLERGNQTGEIYFFEGKKVEPKKIRARAKVLIVNETNSVTDAQAQSQENGGTVTLTEIRTTTQTWRFVP